MSDLKKLPSALTNDELISLIDEKVIVDATTDLINYKNDILSFIGNLQIEPGEYKVNKNTLYLIYKAWSNNPINRNEFSKELGLLFELNNNGKNVLINKNSIKLTHDAYIKFKKETHILKSIKYAEQFNDFIRYHAIESGEYFIEVDFLYIIYTRYAESKQILRPFSKISFEKYCRVNFLSKQLKTGPAFGVKSNVENFFQKGELKKLRREHGKKKKRNKKK